MDSVRRIPTLRTWIGWLICAGLMASLAAATIAGWLSWRDQKEQLRLSMLATSQAIIGSVDRELDQALALARGFAASGALARSDLTAFETAARASLAHYGYTLILTPRNSGHPLIDTYFPVGEPIPDLPVESGSSVDTRLLQGEVVLKPLDWDRLSNRWVLTLQVPVLNSDNQLTFIINLLIPSSIIQRVLDEQRLPPNWGSVVIDLTGNKIVARQPGGDKYVGQAPLQRPDQINEPSRVLEGYSAFGAREVSARYPLGDGVVINTMLLPGLFLVPVLAASLIAFGIVGLALGMFVFAGMLVAAEITALAIATEGVSEGRALALPSFRVREVALLGQALHRAAETVRRQQEHLKAQIAEVRLELRREADERRNAEAALAQSQKVEAIGRLTGGIAHDFNNLLAAIVGNLELLRRRPGLDTRAIRYLDNTWKAAERGTKLTSQLLVFSRSQQLELKPVVLADAIEGMRDLLTRTLGPQIRINLRLDDNRSAVLTDAVQLELAVLNLVINARDAMPEGGEITISTTTEHVANDPELQPGDYVRLSVADTGTGMTVETAARAFEPFFTTKGVGKGTGLGLSQVFGLTQRGGGTARIETICGRGTSVHMFLRRVLESPAAPTANAAQTSSGRSLPSNILIVDDDADMREMLCGFLRERGIVPRVASDGYAALKEIELNPPDLVLMDYAMPGISGAAVAKKIVALFPSIRIVFLTGFADMRAIEQAVGPNASILRKPFRLSDLEATILQASV